MQIKWKKLDENAIIPHYVHNLGDSGFDFYCLKDFVLNPGDNVMIETGLSVEIPDGYEMQIRPKSGLAAKHGITIINSPGTIDASYRGEIKILLHKINMNCNQTITEFKAGNKVAQGVISQVFHPEFIQSYKLDKTKRGGGGFGSTGK